MRGGLERPRQHQACGIQPRVDAERLLHQMTRGIMPAGARVTVAAVGLVAVFNATSAVQDARSVLSEVARTLGAAELRSIHYSGTGFTFAFGQNFRPDAPYPKFHATYSRAIDYERGLAREEIGRTQFEDPPRGGGGQPLYSEARGAATVTANSGWSGGALALTPHGFVQAAMAANPDDELRACRAQRADHDLDHRAGSIHGERLRQRPEPGREDRHVDTESDSRRHADRDDVCQLSRLRRRPVPDAHRAAAGRIPRARAHRRRRAAQRVPSPSRLPPPARAAAGARVGRAHRRRRLVSRGRARPQQPTRGIQGLHRPDRVVGERGASAREHCRGETASHRTSRCATTSTAIITATMPPVSAPSSRKARRSSRTR